MAQEMFFLAQEQKQTVEEVYKTVSAKVEAGKTACFHQNRSEISLASAEILLEKASLLFQNAKAKLSLLWASRCPDFDKVEFTFYEIDEPPSLEHCLTQLERHPELLKARLEIYAREANVRFEKAGAVPDVVLGVGYKTLQDSKEKGLMFGAAVPLPVFDQNRGNIKSARSEKEKAKMVYRELAIHLEHKISLSQKEMMRAYREAGLIRDTILKSAQQSHEYVKEGYKEGKFEYLDLLECEKTLTEMKEKYVQALLEYHLSKADIEYLYSQEQP
jgi:cobalt-zinc-cadmium efflux system outer membrane protein